MDQLCVVGDDSRWPALAVALRVFPRSRTTIRAGVIVAISRQGENALHDRSVFQYFMGGDAIDVDMHCCRSLLRRQ